MFIKNYQPAPSERFSIHCSKTATKVNMFWPIRKDEDNTVDQSKLEAHTFYWNELDVVGKRLRASLNWLSFYFGLDEKWGAPPRYGNYVIRATRLEIKHCKNNAVGVISKPCK